MQLLFYCTVAIRFSVAWTNSYHLVVLAFSCVIHTLRAEFILGTNHGHLPDT